MPTAKLGASLRKFRNRSAQIAHATPLKARLIIIMTTILIVGISVASFVTTGLLKNYLLDKLDKQLNDQGPTLALQLINYSTTSNTESFPSNFYIGLFPDEQSPVQWTMQQTTEKYGIPDLTEVNLDTIRYQESPFTVEGINLLDESTNTSTWRVLPVRTWFVDGTQGVSFVGLPMAEIYATIAQVNRIFFLVTLAVSTIGAFVGFIAVRRSLKPLSNIERTAAAIAQGDLSRRIPARPASTEVGSLALSLNQMLTQIEAAFAAQEKTEKKMRQFISDASHELRTPLATIRGYGELYRMGAITNPDDLKDTMRRIEDSAHRMGDLVEDLLQLTRLDESVEVAVHALDISVIANDAVGDLRALDPTRQVKLVPLKPEGSLQSCFVLANENQIRQVVSNLIGNAARHTPEGTPVEIAYGTMQHNDGELVVLQVRDHGPGVDAQYAEKIFERFYRIDSSRQRASGGSGLGLAIVQAIMTSSGGEITVSQTPGGGLTVQIAFPIAPST